MNELDHHDDLHGGIVWRVLTAWLTVVAVTPAFAEEMPDRTIPVGLQKQLFVDDYVVVEKHNVVRALGKVTKANGGRPVLVADRPWESDNILIGSVFREEGKFKMFYKVGYAEPEPNDTPGITQLRVAYADSSDGLHWTKPNLGIRTFRNSKNNNLINPMGMTDSDFNTHRATLISLAGVFFVF